MLMYDVLYHAAMSVVCRCTTLYRAAKHIGTRYILNTISYCNVNRVSMHDTISCCQTHWHPLHSRHDIMLQCQSCVDVRHYIVLPNTLAPATFSWPLELVAASAFGKKQCPPRQLQHIAAHCKHTARENNVRSHIL